MSRVSLKPSEWAAGEGFTEIVVGLDKGGMFDHPHYFFMAYKDPDADPPIWQGMVSDDAPSQWEVLEFLDKYADKEDARDARERVALDFDPGQTIEESKRQIVVTESSEYIPGIGKVSTVRLGLKR